MTGSVSRRVEKILMTVKCLTFRKNYVSYESLSDDMLTMKVFNYKMWRRPITNSAHHDVPVVAPHGYLVVYVGNERRRFVISVKYLRHQLFKALLKKSEEENGFDHKGGLEIFCDPLVFEHCLWLIGTNNPAADTTSLDELVESYAF